MVLLVAAPGAARDFFLDEGVLGEAPYRLAVPEPREGGVLLIAHGWRPPDAPVRAVLDPVDPVVAAYLERGWIVAATGYRRNGWILEDAARDLEALLGLVAAEYGPVARVVLEGTSLGANIGLLMAEAEPSLVDGVLAIAADPAAEGPDGPAAWTWSPRVPVLLLGNRDEHAPVEDYAGRVGGEGLRPALWVLDRDGHVNLNALERLAAHRALADWLERGVRPPGWVGEPFDATVRLEPPPSVARRRGDGLEGRVLRIDPVHGNLHTDLVAADLEYVAGRRGARFTVRGFGADEPVRWETTFADVPRGHLVAFLDATGRVVIAAHGDSAADRLGVRAGEGLVLEPLGRRKHDPRD
jgi:hypothetical protein